MEVENGTDALLRCPSTSQLDQLQQQLQQQQVQQAKARQASPVGRDLSELRCIVDTRVMEKIPIFDGNEANFCRVALYFRSNVWSSGFGREVAEAIGPGDSR